MELTLDVTVRDYCGVLNGRGEIDLSTAGALASRLELMTSEWDSVIVDLSGVDFIDSSGLGVLVEAHHRLSRSGGRLAVVCPQAKHRRLFAITALDTLFAVEDGLEDALHAIHSPR